MGHSVWSLMFLQLLALTAEIAQADVTPPNDLYRFTIDVLG